MQGTAKFAAFRHGSKSPRSATLMARHGSRWVEAPACRVSSVVAESSGDDGDPLSRGGALGADKGKLCFSHNRGNGVRSSRQKSIA